MNNFFHSQIIRTCAMAMALSAAAVCASSNLAGDVAIRANMSLNSRTAHTGDVWDGSVAVDVIRNGEVVLRRGTPVEGVVTEAHNKGRGTDALLSVKVVSVDGRAVSSAPLAIPGEVTVRKAKNTITGWTVAGALIGGVLHGANGTLGGALTGAAIGKVRAGSKIRQDAIVPVETVLVFRLLEDGVN